MVLYYWTELGEMELSKGKKCQRYHEHRKNNCDDSRAVPSAMDGVRMEYVG